MPFAVRHRNDPIPSMPPLAGWSLHLITDAQRLADLLQRDASAMTARLDAGHRAYVAMIDGVAAAWGWAATELATIGELGFTFGIAPRERYLWNFVTLPAFRGRGIYPRLLNAIVEAESVDTDRFWIAYAPENHASGSGIRKAGFVDLAALSFRDDGQPALADLLPGGARIAARVLGIATSGETLAPCWRCVRAGRRHSCAAGHCACDYQQPQSGCAA